MPKFIQNVYLFFVWLFGFGQEVKENNELNKDLEKKYRDL